MGLVTWCKANGKALHSATEGTGNVTGHSGVLPGFIKSWRAEGESRSTSDRVKNNQAKPAESGRWRGGRLIYGSRAVCLCHDMAACRRRRRPAGSWSRRSEAWNASPSARQSAG